MLMFMLACLKMFREKKKKKRKENKKRKEKKRKEKREQKTRIGREITGLFASQRNKK